MRSLRRKTSIPMCLLLMAAILFSTSPLYAGNTGQATKAATAPSATPASAVNPVTGVPDQPNSKRVTSADRQAAAANAQAKGLQVGKTTVGLTPTPGGTPDYFGPSPNYANSPLPKATAAFPFPTFYFAEGTTRPNFETYFTMQNPSNSVAKVRLTYMKGDGTHSVVNMTIPGHTRSTINPVSTLGSADDAAHDFSTRIQCLNKVQIVAERPMYFNYKGVWTGGHDAVGATATAPAFYFAEGTCRPNFDAYFTIQNPGTKAATIQTTYMKGDGTTAVQITGVPPNARGTLHPADVLGVADDAAHDFSAKIQCTNGQKIVAERPMYFNYKGVWTGGHDAVGATATAKTFYFAEGTVRPNFTPYYTIQNPNGSTAKVTLTYYMADGTLRKQATTLPAHSRGTVTPSTVLGSADVAHDFSAKVECTNGLKILAERPMYFNYNNQWTGGSDVVGTTASASAYYFAEGTSRPNFDPYLCMLNPGDAVANLTVTYMKGNSTTSTQHTSVPANSRGTISCREVTGTGNDAAHDFSIRVECTNGQRIIAERPMYFNYNGVWTGGHTAIGLAYDATGVVAGTGMRKFVDSLPGLGSANANDLGQYIPVAIPDKTSFPGSDYYEIQLGQYTEKLHKDLPATKLRGYRQTNTSDPTVRKFSYLGPTIVAQKGRPVRVKFTNSLPTGSGGNLFIPVDTTVMGAGMGPDGMNMYTQNRATLHLHGGNTPWISDGTMHQWITPAGELTPYPQGVSVQNVPDMTQPVPGDGTETFYYTNQQSARLMFYHDHSYGITRLNVYAGEAAGYVVQDSAEAQLVNNKTIPADQIPLIIQDKTFVPDATQLAAEDPTWDTAKYGAKGSLWFPHVYMPNQNPGSVDGANAMGRWDYGPWFWPPFTGIANPAVANPYYDPVNAPWEPKQIPGTPNPSIVPEGFMDTPLVNGTAYPFVQVGPKTYRFRILNASNDRTLNLQLYYAKSNGQMWKANGTLADGDAGEVNMVPAVPGIGLPATWPTDGRAGGVPDPASSGPTMMQIGSEGGFLPQVAQLPNTPVGYIYNRKDITVLNVSNKTLMLGPAERADVIVDFSKVPDGSKVILYNDAPAPVPAFDPRIDYYTGGPDQTATGGAPTTLAGYGPNTRTIMQFQVSATGKGGMTGFSPSKLKANLPGAYAQFQDKPIVPNAAYNKAFNANYPVDSYTRIQDTTKDFFNGPLAGLLLTNAGSGYTSAPGVLIAGGGGTGATGATQISGVTSIAIDNGGSGYTSPPDIGFSGGGGSGAAATALISGVTSIDVTNGGQGYTAPPDVTISGGGGTGATAVATVANDQVATITVTNGGSGYATPPTVTLVGGGVGATGATASANIAVGSVTGIIITNSGNSYATAPGVGFSGGGGVNAAATATISPGAVTWIALTNPGTNYTSAPTVTLSGGGGANAAAVAVPIHINLQPKAIQELFDPIYGRMNATLGVELPNTSMITQTTIPYAAPDPATEIIKDSNPAAPIGTLADGTQIWKITHNGVDTHAIHWHMFNVQLINRVGWDGMVKPPDANEVGWKETVRMNPLEDVIVALRPIKPNVPWDLPNSIRLLNPTMPPNSTVGFTNMDPSGQPAPVLNHEVNFGWEYVWHCHLLGHEENDMMRPMSVATTPVDASGLSGAGPAGGVVLTWTDNSKNETNWTIMRADNVGGPFTKVDSMPSTTGPATGGTITYTDTTALAATTYYYQIIANNVVGDTTAYALPAIGYPNMSADAGPSNTAMVVVP
jgi:FtsP/CotA-like multicopper oxidase with cupredoxin domain